MPSKFLHSPIIDLIMFKLVTISLIIITIGSKLNDIITNLRIIMFNLIVIDSRINELDVKLG